MYVEISANTFATEMQDMGFKQIDMLNSLELVYSRAIPNSHFEVRIFSSIDVRMGVSRDVGTDAVRIVLWDSNKDRSVKVSKRVNRTGSPTEVMKRVRERAREVWGYYLENKCSNGCGGVMVKRKAKKTGNEFMGCSNWKEGCKNTYNV